jgi:hypothetical protein
VRLLLAALVATVPLSAIAADLPAPFLGTWRVANPTDSACRKGELNGAPEGHIVVKAGLIEQYESSCRIVSVRPTRNATDGERVSVAVDLVCSGEGMTWRDRSLWHLETVDGKKLIALTTLASDVRDVRGRRVKGRVLPTTTIYAECR